MERYEKTKIASILGMVGNIFLLMIIFLHYIFYILLNQMWGVLSWKKQKNFY